MIRPCSIISYRRAGRDCLVRYQNNSYSVPTAWAGQTLLVKETEDRRILLFNAAGELVAEHGLLRGHHQWSVQAEHYAGLPVAVSRPPRVHLAFQDGTSLMAPQVEQRPLSVYA